MTFRKIIIIISLFLLGVIAVLGVALLVINGKKKNKTFTQYTETNTSETTTNENSQVDEYVSEEVLYPIDDLIYVDFSKVHLPDEEKDSIVSEICSDSEEYMTYIFNYEGYSEEYENYLNSRKCTGDYHGIKDYYVTTIIRAFENNEFRSETQEVKPLRVVYYEKGEDNNYAFGISGYVKVKASSKDLKEKIYYIPYEDYICYKEGEITRFYVFFDYIFKEEGFGYQQKDDYEKTIRFNGDAGYPFNLDQYNPNFDEANDYQGFSTTTDATGE